ncbi:hypothetical protein C2W62_21815 [Candidatus Entotheonella serta]|nr:hypothetical protein C2W62_21815 [Candidatus Entotheonella serta]
MADFAQNIAKRLRALRGDDTQRAFAARLGITHATLNRLEQGRENITLRTLQKICDRLGCTAAWLLDDYSDADQTS